MRTTRLPFSPDTLDVASSAAADGFNSKSEPGRIECTELFFRRRGSDAN